MRFNCVRQIYANNNSNHALPYKELHFGGLDGLEPFWGKWGPKTPKYSREIGIFHVKLKTPITQKRRNIEKKNYKTLLQQNEVALSESAIFVNL